MSTSSGFKKSSPSSSTSPTHKSSNAPLVVATCPTNGASNVGSSATTGNGNTPSNLNNNNNYEEKRCNSTSSSGTSPSKSKSPHKFFKGKKSTPPTRLKGMLLKRCRSFKEDLFGRMHSKSSLDCPDDRERRRRNSSVYTGPGTSNSQPLPPHCIRRRGLSPTKDSSKIHIPQLIKEASLTLDFMESVIQKNGVDLLSGSSNVLLDLIGCLLSDVKATNYQFSSQAISIELKSRLCDFLSASDTLLLDKELRLNPQQKELHLAKILESMVLCRDALKHLKEQYDKESGSSPTSGSSSMSKLTDSESPHVVPPTIRHEYSNLTHLSFSGPVSNKPPLVINHSPSSPVDYSPDVDLRPPLPEKKHSVPSTIRLNGNPLNLNATPLSTVSQKNVWKSADSSSWAHLTLEEKKSNVATWVEWTDSAIYNKPHGGTSSSGERTCATRTYSDSCKEISSINSSFENLLSNPSSCGFEDDNNSVFLDEHVAPELPRKQNPHHLALYSTSSTTSNSQFLLQSNSNNNGFRHSSSRSISPYDNVSEQGEAQLRGLVDQVTEGQGGNSSSLHASSAAATDFRSGRRVSRSFEVGDRCFDDDEDGPPPALPPKKKKHSLIAAYVDVLATSWQQETYASKQRVFSQEFRSLTLDASSSMNPLFPSPRRDSRSFSPTRCTAPEYQYLNEEEEDEEPVMEKPPLPPKKHSIWSRQKSIVECQVTEPDPCTGFVPTCNQQQGSSCGPMSSPEKCSSLGVAPVTTATSRSNSITHSPSYEAAVQDDDTLYMLSVEDMLIRNEESSNSSQPKVKGGEPMALLVYATNPDYKGTREEPFRNSFVTTYRTFIGPFDLLTALWKRYTYLDQKSGASAAYIRNGQGTLALFVEAMGALTPMDLNDSMISFIKKCIYTLINVGEISNAYKARKTLYDKFEGRLRFSLKREMLARPPVQLAVTTLSLNLYDWSSTTIAEQMTLLDSELFTQLQTGELLIWAEEQSEEFCPALTQFTEHFNKVSMWARTIILQGKTARERSRIMKKLTQTMRRLRDLNNYNSLLAVLAALDSGPIRRLFGSSTSDHLKPYAALTDSSMSFKNYRTALANSSPPCIPYIGLILQDLTFVHIGNPDWIGDPKDRKVNWVKRWQQYTVLEPIRRFQQSTYGFQRNEALLSYINNFDEFLSEDELWGLSETIKPRTKNQ